MTPHWFAGNSRFWYRNDLAGGEREFILVDAAKGTRQAAFDHARLAAALAKATGKPIDAKRLPIEGLDFSDNEPVVLVRSEGRPGGAICGATSCGKRRGTENPARPASSLPVRNSLKASRRTGPETSITFVNRTKADVDVFWLDAEGERRPYGTVQAGQEREQHTFAGHVWLVTDRQGKVLAAFEATEEPGTAVIGGTPGDGDGGRREGTRKSGPRDRGGGGRGTLRTGLPAPAARLRASRAPDSSPDGQWHAFFKDHNLYVRDVKKGEEFPLSTDGTAEDEYSGRICWSPDSKKIAVLRTKKGDERKVYYVESSPKDQLQPKLHSYDYLKPGDRIPLSKPQLFDVAGRKHIPDQRRAVPQSLEHHRPALGARFAAVHLPLQPARPPGAPRRRRGRRHGQGPADHRRSRAGRSSTTPASSSRTTWTRPARSSGCRSATAGTTSISTTPRPAA